MSRHGVRIGIVGDIHLAFDDVDVAQLDAQGYALVLFVGDLAGYSQRGGLDVARRIGQLSTRAIAIPGNHDAANVAQMAAEVFEADALIPWLNMGQRGREEALVEALGAAELAGYSTHRVTLEDRTLDVIAARPHSAGGPRIAFRPHLRERFGVSDIEDSVRRLTALIDESDADELIFLAHNGPSGLGSRRDDIWGCDFKKEAGDFGDRDLERAIAHARRRERKITAVVAGHMHHALRGGGSRRWSLERDGVLYVNAARVPRVFERGGRTLHHHIALDLGGARARAKEVLLAEDR